MQACANKVLTLLSPATVSEWFHPSRERVGLLRRELQNAVGGKGKTQADIKRNCVRIGPEPQHRAVGTGKTYWTMHYARCTAPIITCEALLPVSATSPLLCSGTIPSTKDCIPHHTCALTPRTHAAHERGTNCPSGYGEHGQPARGN